MNGGVRRWVSVSEPVVGGLEWIGAACSPEALGATLESAFGSARALDAVFLLVRISSTDRRGVERSLGVASEFSGRTRVCLAISDQTLYARRLRVGSLPLGLVCSWMESTTNPTRSCHPRCNRGDPVPVRFRRSRGAPRQDACALDSILSLARNLGLAALAPSGDALERGLLADFAFDWIPASSDADADLSAIQRRREHSDAASVVE